MHKSALIFLMLLPLISFSQVPLSFQRTDSLTYQYYLTGDWKKLIELSNEAGKLNIDSKFIRQRTGYAYFMTGDYYAAINQYEKALEFDHSDDVTKEYLYYSCLNAGSSNTRFYAGNLSNDSSSKLGILPYNAVETIDTEFNLKTNQTTTRSNQTYFRIGINSELGYRVSLYQAYSFYKQTVSKVLSQQPEYLALLKFTVSPIWHIKAAYHGIFTNVGTTKYTSNLGFIALSSQLNRFNLEANASVLKSSSTTTQQVGFQAGAVLPGRSNIYFTSSVIGIKENSTNRIIFSETAGLKLTKYLWAESNITLGNLKNYNTYNSLYVYNSVDPSVFRTGISLFYFLGKHLSLIGNFTFDQQEIENNTLNKNYYQYSYSGGLKWKL
jgi:tetratricopeptide (TPR) repeat protein